MSSRWIDVVPLEGFGPGASHFIDVDDLSIAVFNLEGEFYAVEDICSHHGVRMLSSGVGAKFVVHGDRLMCPRHGAEFNIRTGAPLSPPACAPIRCLEVRVEGDKLQVQIPPAG